MANAADLSKGLPGFYKKADFEGGRTETVTIKAGTIESVGVGQNAEEKPTLSFLENKKKLVLNSSRISQLQALFGAEEVEGKKITLYVGPYKVNGRDMDMVCIKAAD